jgi:hypothetical protein
VVGLAANTCALPSLVATLSTLSKALAASKRAEYPFPALWDVENDINLYFAQNVFAESGELRCAKLIRSAR